MLYFARISLTPVATSKEVRTIIFLGNTYFLPMIIHLDLTTVATPASDLAELTAQQQFKSAWLSLVPSFPKANIHILPSIEDGVNMLRDLDSASEVPLKVLAAGSLYLVGGLIEVAGLSAVAL